VTEVIETARRVTGCAITVNYEPRRAGDPPRLVADSRLAREVLGWRPQRAALETIIEQAWAWEHKYPWTK
jgi:UDP-glucose 4-epimerase